MTILHAHTATYAGTPGTDLPPPTSATATKKTKTITCAVATTHH